MRTFYTVETDGEVRKVVQGVVGYFATDHTPEQAAELNEQLGNTVSDVNCAVGCSMFGWDTPLASQLTQ